MSLSRVESYRENTEGECIENAGDRRKDSWVNKGDIECKEGVRRA